MTTTIESRVFYPAFIEPTKPLTPSADPRYGCLILAANVPADLQEYITPKPPKAILNEFADLTENDWMVFIPQGFKPRLTFTNGMDGLRQFDDLQELCRAANIGPDRLFHGGPAQLAVEPVEWIEPATIGQRKAPQAVKRLQIVAIRADTKHLTANLERMLTEHFKP